jgi:hypothetical protein
MRRLWSTLVLLVLLIGLGAYIAWSEWTQPTPAGMIAAKPKALGIAASSIGQFTIKSAGGEITTVAKAGEKWQITSPLAADADEGVVTGITRGISSLEVGRVIAEDAIGLEQYGLEPPKVEVTVKASGDRAVMHLHMGDKTAAGDHLYAMANSDRKVFLVPAVADATFNKSTWDLRDKRVLRFDRVGVESVEIVAPRHIVRLARRDLEWDLTRPLQTEADFGVVSELLSKLATSQMASLTEAESVNLARYGLVKPLYRVTVDAGGSRTTLDVGSPADAATSYARDHSRSGVFTIEQSLVAQLAKDLTEFRRKELFAFQTHNARRLELARQGQTSIYERATHGERQPWRELSPNAREIEASRMETALSRLSLLRAVGFVDRRRIGTGLDAPAISVVVTYTHVANAERLERVTIAATAAGQFAANAEWSDAATLDPSAYRFLIEALDGLRH